MNFCKVYQTKQEIIIITTSRTEAGLFIDDDPVFLLPADTDAKKLFEKITEALSASRINVPDIPKADIPAWQKKMLKKTGQTSYSSLYKNSSCCSISSDGKTLSITPYRMREPGNAGKGIIAAKELQVTLLLNKENETEAGDRIIEMLKNNFNS